MMIHSLSRIKPVFLIGIHRGFKKNVELIIVSWNNVTSKDTKTICNALECAHGKTVYHDSIWA